MAFQAKERFRFVFSGLTHGSDGTSVLVAGDSNVRHICNSIDADSKNVDHLTIPGARILRDGKGFLNALTAKLSRNTFERLYLHLGSNDVLSSQEKYMSSLMSLCDHIHEMSPDTNIYLCEILPRELDCSYNKYTGLKTRRDLSQVRSWIESIKRAVEEVCHYIPYLQYHVYTKHFHGKELLRRDGLHLNSEGGEMCWRSIKLDILNDMDTPTQGTTGFILGDEQWPPLNSREKECNIEEISEGLPALYSDVVQSVLENTHQIIETVTVSSTSQPTQFNRKAAENL